MKTRMFLAALAGASLVAGAAQAQSVNRREANQQRRIDNGVASGRLTPGEAARDQRQQYSINAQEARMRARDGGGRLTAFQRGRLQQREDNASHRIYNTKHNWRGR